MPFVIREKPNYLPLINGVAFAACAAGSISAELSDEQAEEFLGHEGYRLATEDEAPATAVPAKQETAAQKKAREKAEKADADKAAAEKAAAEKEAADKAAAEREAAEKAAAAAGEGGNDDEVF